MKKFTLVISIISVIIAALALVLNIRVIFGKGIFVGFAMFSMMKSGGFMGYIGNILGVLVTVAAFAAMGLYGFAVSALHKENARKPSLISGVIVAALALVSLIFSIANHAFTFGDVVMLLFPLVFVFCIIQSVED